MRLTGDRLDELQLAIYHTVLSSALGIFVRPFTMSYRFKFTFNKDKPYNEAIDIFSKADDKLVHSIRWDKSNQKNLVAYIKSISRFERNIYIPINNNYDGLFDLHKFIHPDGTGSVVYLTLETKKSDEPPTKRAKILPKSSSSLPHQQNSAEGDVEIDNDDQYNDTINNNNDNNNNNNNNNN